MPLAKTVTLGPFAGINNRLERHALQRVDAPDFLAGALNTDIDVTGRLSRSDGATSISPLTTGRSMFSDGTRTLFADGTDLKRITAFAPFAASTIDTVAASPIAYAESNGEIFYTDNIKLRCLDATNTVRTVGVPVPISLSGVAIAGSLQPAWYQATITYFNGVEEGGAYPSINVELTSIGGIRLSLPVTPAGVTAVGVYLSGPNGEVPLLYNAYVPSTATVDLVAEPAGRAVQTQFKAPMPAGEHLAFCLGRLISASGSVLHYSEPYNYGMTNPAKNYIAFPEAITVVAPCKDGVYVVAEKTYWITNFADPLGDPVLPYGAVARSGGTFPNENKVFWLSERGLVIGDAMGQVKNVQEENMLLTLSGSGSSLFVEGNNRIIATND